MNKRNEKLKKRLLILISIYAIVLTLLLYLNDFSFADQTPVPDSVKISIEKRCSQNPYKYCVFEQTDAYQECERHSDIFLKNKTPQQISNEGHVLTNCMEKNKDEFGIDYMKTLLCFSFYIR